MTKINAFAMHANEYDDWFLKNEAIYLSEVKAVRSMLTHKKNGLEIGVGSARFAFLLDVKVGIEPCSQLAKLARGRGITVYENVAEDLPFNDGEFDFVLMITVICFFDDVHKAFKEANRVLCDDGVIIVGFIDKNSHLGRRYHKNKAQSTFMQEATFYDVDEVVQMLKNAGFGNFELKQTLFNEDSSTFQTIKHGCGEGGFVIIKATKL